MSRATRLHVMLTQDFAPLELEIIDESACHRGHAGARPEGETHFAIRMVARHFTGQSRVERQRHVLQRLQAELKNGLHAIRLDLRAPDETRQA